MVINIQINMKPYTQRLSTFFIPLLIYVEQRLNSADNLDFETLQQEVIQRLELAQTQALAAHYSAEDSQQALFATVAWIDEKIMTSSWAGAMTWRLVPLQQHYFHTNKAGVEFFQRLQSLNTEQSAIKEVYAAVLTAGFKGQYSGKGPQVTSQKIRNTLEELKAQQAISSWSPDESLFQTSPYLTKSYAAQFRRQRYQPTLTLLILIGVPIFILLAVFVYLDMSLSQMVSALTERE